MSRGVFQGIGIVMAIDVTAREVRTPQRPVASRSS
jgi:hypothetical protein